MVNSFIDDEKSKYNYINKLDYVLGYINNSVKEVETNENNVVNESDKTISTPQSSTAIEPVESNSDKKPIDNSENKELKNDVSEVDYFISLPSKIELNHGGNILSKFKVEIFNKDKITPYTGNSTVKLEIKSKNNFNLIDEKKKNHLIIGLYVLNRMQIKILLI
ncbi:hypothetical protein [Enterococcus hirae]